MKEYIEFCSMCSRETYPDSFVEVERPQWIEELGYVCLICALICVDDSAHTEQEIK